MCEIKPVSSDSKNNKTAAGFNYEFTQCIKLLMKRL